MILMRVTSPKITINSKVRAIEQIFGTNVLSVGFKMKLEITSSFCLLKSKLTHTLL